MVGDTFDESVTVDDTFDETYKKLVLGDPVTTPNMKAWVKQAGVVVATIRGIAEYELVRRDLVMMTNSCEGYLRHRKYPA
jgi:hypothetical protein